MCLVFRVEGGELFNRVVNGKFSERIAKLVFYQMLVAVTVCASMLYTLSIFTGLFSVSA